MIYIESGRTWRQAINSGPVPLGEDRREEEFCGFKHPPWERVVCSWCWKPQLWCPTPGRRTSLPHMKTSGTNKKPSPCSLRTCTCRLTSRNKLEEAVWDFPRLWPVILQLPSPSNFGIAPHWDEGCHRRGNFAVEGDRKGSDLALHLNRVGAVAAGTYRGNGLGAISSSHWCATTIPACAPADTHYPLQPLLLWYRFPWGWRLSLLIMVHNCGD